MDRQPQEPSRSCRQARPVPSQTSPTLFQQTATPVAHEIRQQPSVAATTGMIPVATTTTKKQNIAMLLACTFFVGAFIGVIIETLWGLITLHTLERRSGLLFFPFFNPVYGAGAIALTLISRIGNEQKSNWKIFIRATLAGAALEYLISFAQETATGSVSWDYSAMPLNIGGRVHILYCVAWGLLGLLWIKVVLPPVERFSQKIDTQIGRNLMLVAVLIMSFDLACSGMAMYRWSERTKGITAHTVAGQYFDQRYPDPVMKRYYPNLRIAPDHR